MPAPAPCGRIVPIWNADRSCYAAQLRQQSRAQIALCARTPQPRLNVKRKQAFATIPIVPNLPRLRSIRLLGGRTHDPCSGPVLLRDLTEPSRFT
jgi:hypothetical protein